MIIEYDNFIKLLDDLYRDINCYGDAHIIEVYYSNKLKIGWKNTQTNHSWIIKLTNINKFCYSNLDNDLGKEISRNFSFLHGTVSFDIIKNEKVRKIIGRLIKLRAFL